MYRIPACVLFENMCSSTSSQPRRNSGAENIFYPSERDGLQYVHYELELLHEINGVQDRSQMKMFFTRSRYIQQNKNMLLEFALLDDPIEVGLGSVSTGVNITISYNRPLVSH